MSSNLICYYDQFVTLSLISTRKIECYYHIDLDILYEVKYCDFDDMSKCFLICTLTNEISLLSEFENRRLEFMLNKNVFLLQIIFVQN